MQIQEPDEQGKVGTRVFILGLEKAKEHNFSSGEIVQSEEEGRLGVKLKSGKALSVRRRNVLFADNMAHRKRLLLHQVWEKQLELRVAGRFLHDKLFDVGVCLQIASFFQHREALFHFSGYKGRVLPESWCGTWKTRSSFEWKQLAVMPCPRIDCASVSLGNSGLVLFAGGCGKHPRLCNPDDFLRSAAMYDSLSDSWANCGELVVRRHGCSGASLDSKVYVIGGEYAHSSPYMARGQQSRRDLWRQHEGSCEVFDLKTRRWSELPSPVAELHDSDMDPATLAFRARTEAGTPNLAPLAGRMLRPRCFAALGAASGRLVAVGGITSRESGPDYRRGVPQIGYWPTMCRSSM